jgi:hypothetical protein
MVSYSFGIYRNGHRKSAPICRLVHSTTRTVPLRAFFIWNLVSTLWCLYGYVSNFSVWFLMLKIWRFLLEKSAQNSPNSFLIIEIQLTYIPLNMPFPGTSKNALRYTSAAFSPISALLATAPCLLWVCYSATASC